MNALVVPLTLTKRDFQTNAESARLDMERLKGSVGQVSGELTVLQRETRAAGTATEAEIGKIKELETALKGLSKELRTAKADYKILSELAPPPLPTSTPDESGRLTAHWAKLEEQERSRRANEAAANTRIAMPAASGPKAAIMVAEAAEGAAGVGISRMGRMELGHVARSLAGSAAAGVPVGQSLEMEAPRLISALGPAVMSAVGGFGGLMAVLAPLTAAVAAGAVAFTVYNANQAATKQRNSNDLLGNVFNRGGDTVSELNKETEEADNAQRATRKMRRSKRNRLANVFGSGGLHDEDVEDIRKRDVGIRDRRDEAMERDAGFSRRALDGDQGVEQERLKVQLEEKIREITVSRVRDGSRLIAIAKEEYQTAIDGIARKQQAQAIETTSERELLSIRAAGTNVETESAAARVRAAQALLEDGPAAGPEHDESANKLTAALVEQQQAERNQASRAAAIVSEEKIVAIKRAGLDVDVQIAQERLKAAQAALDRNPAKSGVEYDALKQSVDAARFEVDAATKATHEKQAQLQLETQIANLRGSSDQVRRQTLALEAAHLRELIHSTATTPDERRGFKKDLRQNRQQQDEFDKNQKLRSIDTAETSDRAKAGRSLADQIELLNNELRHNEERKDWNKNENGSDPQMGAQLDETAKKLAQTLDDLNFAEQKRLQSLSQQDAAIQNRGYQPDARTKNFQADEKYLAEIDEEKHGKNDPAVIAKLNSNREHEKFENEVDDEQMTPSQRRARDRHNLKRDQAVARV